MSERFDVIIVGGGLVGATAAVALARAGRRVAVIEAQNRPGGSAAPQAAKPSHDDRTLVINAASLNILGHLQLLPEPAVRCPISSIRITRQGGLGNLTLNARDYGRDPFGQVIVAQELGRVALAALTEHEHIREYCPDRLIRWTTAADGVEVELESGQRLNSRLLIGADGNQSVVRQQAELTCLRHDYGQSAMIFNVRPQKPATGTAFERFTAQGPLALLPQPEGRMGVVWIDSTSAIDEAMGWDDDRLLGSLRQRFGPDLGRFEQAGKRARYPLVRQRTTVPIADRVVLIGNAANAVHPVSAQGFNLGLRDVAGLVDALADWDDLNLEQALQHYARQRAPDQDATVRYTDTLARAFTNPSGLARLASGLGLVAHAALPGLRHRLVQAAMGFRQPVSSLARAGYGEHSRLP
ncbi:MAG: FAD-dependent oxidoreductase [Pseudomonadota bacterium]